MLLGLETARTSMVFMTAATIGWTASFSITFSSSSIFFFSVMRHCSSLLRFVNYISLHILLLDHRLVLQLLVGPISNLLLLDALVLNFLSVAALLYSVLPSLAWPNTSRRNRPYRLPRKLRAHSRPCCSLGGLTHILLSWPVCQLNQIKKSVSICMMKVPHNWDLVYMCHGIVGDLFELDAGMEQRHKGRIYEETIF